MFPKKVVEIPDQTRTHWREWFEVNALPRTGSISPCIIESMQEFVSQRFLADLPKVHAHFDPWQDVLPFCGPPDTDRFTKIRSVLDPIELDV